MRFLLVAWATVLLALLGATASRADEARGLQLPGGVTVGDDLVGQRTALCIGIDGYRHERYGPLRYAAADARAMAKVLEANGYAVTLLVDDDPAAPPERVPNYRSLDDAVHRICRASRSPNDTLLICFSGHGDVIGGQSVLLPLDHHVEERVLTVGALLDALGRARAAKKLLLLDACRSGKRDGARLLQAGFLASLGAGRDVVVISGCGADQYSYEDDTLGMGRLTKTIVEGLGGAAFGERREFLYGYELWDHVARRFQEQGWTATQSPTMFGSWDARVRFDLARREVAPPPALTGADRALYDIALKSAFEKVGADDLTACIEFCGTALRIVEGDADALSLRAFAYQTLGFYERARVDVDAVLAKDPDNVYALVIRCFVADALGDPAVFDRDGVRALLHFRKDPERWVRRLPPTLASYVWLAYALALTRVGRPIEEQQAAYERVLAIEGASAKAAGWAHMFRGEILLALGQTEQGMAEFGRAIERGAAEAEVVTNARARRGQTNVWLGRAEDALADLDWVLAHATEFPYAAGLAWTGKASLALQAGRVEDALGAYDQLDALADGVNHFRSLAGLGKGRIHRDQGRLAEAIQEFSRALGLGWVAPETRAWVLVERGAAEVGLCRYAEGLGDLEAGLAVPGTSAEVRAVAGNWKGTTLQRLDRHEEASRAFLAVTEVPGAPDGEVAAARVRLAVHRLAANAADEVRTHIDLGLASAALSPDLRVLGLVVLARLSAPSGTGESADALLTRALAVEGASPSSRRFVEMERSALRPDAAPPGGEGPEAAWSRMLHHLARREWEACERACAAGRAEGYAPADVYWALAERWHLPGEPPETEVVFAWLRTGWTQDDDVRRVLGAYLAEHPSGPLAARAARILEEMKE